MADFRENVLPVVFNSLFSAKNDARNIKNNVETIKQNQILKVQVMSLASRNQSAHNCIKVAKSNDNTFYFSSLIQSRFRTLLYLNLLFC